MNQLPPDVREQRYEGRPLLRLLDCYVLALTGHLDLEMERKVTTMVKHFFGGDDDWKSTLRNAIKLPPDLDAQITKLWNAQPDGLDPLEFMLAVSDENFLPLIDPD